MHDVIRRANDWPVQCRSCISQNSTLLADFFPLIPPQASSCFTVTERHALAIAIRFEAIDTSVEANASRLKAIGLQAIATGSVALLSDETPPVRGGASHAPGCSRSLRRSLGGTGGRCKGIPRRVGPVIRIHTGMNHAKRALKP